MCRVIVVGLSGPTCSGKTTVADKLTELWGEGVNQNEWKLTVIKPLLHLDDHFIKGLQTNDWESPRPLAVDNFLSSVNARKQEISAQNCGQESCRVVRIILAEGFLLHAIPQCWGRLLDVKIFVEISKETCWRRRLLRNRDDDAAEYFNEKIWPKYVKYAKPVIGEGTDPTVFVLNGELEAEVLFVETVRVIDAVLSMTSQMRHLPGSMLSQATFADLSKYCN